MMKKKYSNFAVKSFEDFLFLVKNGINDVSKLRHAV
jgi:hypothetical protein